MVYHSNVNQLLNNVATTSVEIIQFIDRIAAIALDHLDVAHEARGNLLVLIHQIDLDLHADLGIFPDGKAEQIGHILGGI